MHCVLLYSLCLLLILIYLCHLVSSVASTGICLHENLDSCSFSVYSCIRAAFWMPNALVLVHSLIYVCRPNAFDSSNSFS